jgi:hypothetical protein
VDLFSLVGKVPYISSQWFTDRPASTIGFLGNGNTISLARLLPYLEAHKQCIHRVTFIVWNIYLVTTTGSSDLFHDQLLLLLHIVKKTTFAWSKRDALFFKRKAIWRILLHSQQSYILVITKGKIKSDGSPSQLTTQFEVYQYLANWCATSLASRTQCVTPQPRHGWSCYPRQHSCLEIS